MSRLFCEIVERTDRAGLRVHGAKDKARHPGLHERTGAHGTRFQRHVQSDARQSPDTQMLSRCIQREDFGMGEGIAVHLSAVETRSDDVSIMDRHRTDRDLSECRGFPRERERLLHESFVVTHGDGEKKGNAPWRIRTSGLRIRSPTLYPAELREQIFTRCYNDKWRRERDSNPRYPFEYAGLANLCLQPLGHLSNSSLSKNHKTQEHFRRR